MKEYNSNTHINLLFVDLVRHIFGIIWSRPFQLCKFAKYGAEKHDATV